MLVTSSVCHRTSYSTTSFPWPLRVATSTWRTAARHCGASRSTTAAVVMICMALAWLVMRLAVCTVAPNTSRFSSTTGPKWQPMRKATGWPSTFELRMAGDLLLHLRGGVERLVGVGEGRHDLIAHGLDDRALVLLGRGSHDIDADGHHVPGPQVAHQLIEPCGTHDVSEQNGQLDIFSHAPIRRGAVPSCHNAAGTDVRDYTQLRCYRYFAATRRSRSGPAPARAPLR